MSSKKTDKKIDSKNVNIWKYIHCDVYKCGVSIFIGECEALKKWAKKVYNGNADVDMLQGMEATCTEADYIENNVAARCYVSSGGACIVHLPRFSFTYNPQEITSLSHEVLHAAFGILDYIGVEYRYGGSNEPYTYLHEFILKNALIRNGYRKA